MAIIFTIIKFTNYSLRIVSLTAIAGGLIYSDEAVGFVKIVEI